MRFKWVAYCHDWAFEDKSNGTFEDENECYKDMQAHALEKMKWNTSIEDGDFEYCENDYTDGITYEVHFAKKMIVHKSYSGTYVYLIVNEDENLSYYDVFSKERVEELKGLGYLDPANISTIESYRRRHEEQVKKEQEDKEKKKTYEVTIKTTITRTYTIDADTEQGAIEQATENPNDYDNEDINEETEVLDIEDYA